MVVFSLEKVALHHGEVQQTLVELGEQGLGVIHDHMHVHLGMALHIGSQLLGQGVFADGERSAEADGLPSKPHVLQIPAQLLLVVEHGDRRVAQHGALRRQGQPFVPVVEQLDAVVLLKVLDMLGDGGLGDIELRGRPGVIQVLAHRQKGLHPKVQHRAFLLK